MKVQNNRQIEQQRVEMPGAHDCTVRWLIGQADDAPNFAMRQFEVAPGGYTPRHSHPYEHEIYVLEGEGVIVEDETDHALRQGDVVYVAPDDMHQFRNTGDQPLKFLCLIPNSAAGLPVTLAPECGVEKPRPAAD